LVLSEFLTFVKNQRKCQIQWREAVDECVRLKSELDKSLSQIVEYESKLASARAILHREREQAVAVALERDELVSVKKS